MRKVAWKNRNKMEIDTGHRQFDRQCDALGTGNRIGSTQFSNYIRAFETPFFPDDTTPAEPGAMQAFDLNHFKDLPSSVLAAVKRHARDEDVILYQFSHAGEGYDRDGYRRSIVHGYVLSRCHDGGNELLEKFVTGPTRKSARVIDVCAEYVSNTREELGLKASDDAKAAAVPRPRFRVSGLVSGLADRLVPAGV